MYKINYPIVMIDGSHWAVNTSIVLTSYPEQYNIINLETGKYSYVFCHLVSTFPRVGFISEQELEDTLTRLKEKENERKTTT